MDDRERRLRLEALFSEHAVAVGAYLARRTDAASVDDALMEVFVVACRRLDAVPSEALPWLLGCARRVLANQRRSARRAEALVDRMAGEVARFAEAIDRDGHLSVAVGELADLDREVLLLSAWEGLEPAAIAEVLGCSRVAVRSRLHRARRRLATTIERPAGNAVREAPAEVNR